MEKQTAIEILRKHYSNAPFSERTALETLIPELKESEDERIIKEIISIVKSYRESCITEGNHRFDNCLAWLEKQREQKQHFELKAGHWYICHRAFCCRADHLTVKEGERFMCEKDGIVKGFIIKDPENYFIEINTPTDKIEPLISEVISSEDGGDELEPKFHEGDWIIRSAEGFKNNIYLVTEVKDYYVCEDLNGTRVTFTFNDVHKNFKLWDISDSKDGDVLKEDSCIFIIERMKPDRTAIVHCCLFDDDDFDLVGSNLSFDADSTYPATKEQRDLLFSKMKEAGYKWDDERKELKRAEQKSDRSEDDEDKIMKELIYNIIVSNDNTPSSKEIFSAYSKTKEDALAWIEKQNDQNPAHKSKR